MRNSEEIKQELKNNYGDEKEKQRKIDLLKYQANEISEAKLKNSIKSGKLISAKKP